MIATVPPKARACLTAALFVALVAAAWTALSQPAAGKAARDRLFLLALLDTGEYERLDAYLVRLQWEYERGDHSEAKLENAFAAFASADAELQPKLDSWVERRPQSFAAHLARGEYYRHLGWIALQNGPLYPQAISIPESASEFLSLARQDVQAAIERHPRLGIGYASLINIAMAENTGAEADRWFRLGIEADPGSVSLRRAYLLSLRPWQRPDQDPVELMTKLDALVQDLRETHEDDPDLAALRGFHAYITAELLRRQRRHNQASRYYRDALVEGSDRVFLRGAGINAFQSAKQVAAIGYFTDALALRPQDPRLLDSRARALWSLGNHEAALDDWRFALSIDPGNPHILYGYAEALRSLGRAERAAEVIAGAAPFAHNSPKIRGLRGRMLLADLGRPRDAIPDLRYAVGLDPHAGESWRAYAEALYRSNDCDGAATAIVTYQRLCANGTRCPDGDLMWAKEALRGTRDPDICPVYGILGP
jgi:tetratricopeptide (TPR) repeat protein